MLQRVQRLKKVRSPGQILTSGSGWVVRRVRSVSKTSGSSQGGQNFRPISNSGLRRSADNAFAANPPTTSPLQDTVVGGFVGGGFVVGVCPMGCFVGHSVSSY